MLTKAITNEYLQGIFDPFSLTTLIYPLASRVLKNSKCVDIRCFLIDLKTVSKLKRQPNIYSTILIFIILNFIINITDRNATP